jgi:hypothetical protein
MIAVTPGVAAISSCTGISSVRSRSLTCGGKAARSTSSFGSTTAVTLATPIAISSRAICCAVRPPSLGWPPVIATASLNRLL